MRISRSQLSKALRKKARWRRPRHTLKGRQTESEMERVGLRLQLRKQRAEAGDIVLLYGDESEALTHPYLARAWAKAGADLRVPAPGQAKKSRCWGRSITSRANSSFTPARPSAAAISSPISSNSTASMDRSPRQAKPVVLTEDNGPIHTSKCSLAALVARAHWLTVEWLPKYAPELNDIEPVSRILKAHHLAHQTFTDAAALDQAIHDAVTDLNRERIPDPLAKPQIRPLKTMPTRYSMRGSGATPALRSTMPFCTSIAQRTASTTPWYSTIEPSPVRLTTRPRWTAIVGSMRSLRSPLTRASVRSSSAPARRLKPTISATRIAAAFGSRSLHPSGRRTLPQMPAQHRHRALPLRTVDDWRGRYVAGVVHTQAIEGLALAIPPQCASFRRRAVLTFLARKLVALRLRTAPTQALRRPFQLAPGGALKNNREDKHVDHREDADLHGVARQRLHGRHHGGLGRSEAERDPRHRE